LSAALRLYDDSSARAAGEERIMFIEVPDESALGADATEWYRRQRDSWGYLPNYAAAFALRPDVAEAWNALNGSIRQHMDRRRYELVTIAAAREYRSTYCTAAHSKFLRDDCGDEPTMLAFAADPGGAALDATDRAVVTLAAKVARDAASVTAADVEQVRAQGLSEDEIVDVVGVLRAVVLLTAESEEAVDAGVAVRAVQPRARCAPRELSGFGCAAERLARPEQCFDIDTVVDGSVRC
jgi:uncharacterized peroxidase-related enzyme